MRWAVTQQPQSSERVAGAGRALAKRMLHELDVRGRDRYVEPCDGADVVRDPATACGPHLDPENAPGACLGAPLNT